MLAPVVLLLAAVDAPVTDVTVFSDRARVVRTANVTLSNKTVLEFPPLPPAADVSTVRVEVSGGSLERVDLGRLEEDQLPVDEVKKVIAELNTLDDQLFAARGEVSAVQAQLQSLQRLQPQVPGSDPLKPSPKLSANGWPQVLAFVAEQEAKLQAKLRDGGEKVRTLDKQRAEAAERGRLLGASPNRQAWRVTAQASGSGAAKATLTYFVMRARWYPVYDLTLAPETQTVSLSFSGLVSQESGEDWGDAQLTLSTAVPAAAQTLPKILTWKIGEKDRFIPTPTPVGEGVKPAPPVPPLMRVWDEKQTLRTKLAQTANRYGAAPQGSAVTSETSIDFAGDEISGELAPPEYDQRKKQKYEPPRPAAPPPPPPGAAYDAPAPAPVMRESRVASSDDDEAPEVESDALVLVAGTRSSQPSHRSSPFSLAPPPGYRAPTFAPELPASAAGGFDLSFPSLQKETVPSGKGARRIGLFAENWPVSVERKVFPALFPEAFLVAELKNPAARPLPAGVANLFVGADPAGTARLKLVSPGESFTLPLGIDRALRPVRNVKVTQSEEGVFSKDDLSKYVVTLELANPHRTPVAVRLYDQIPITTDKKVEVKLLETKPVAIQDQRIGKLEWRLTIAPNTKTVVTYSYTLKRPKGWRMQQSEVSP